MAYNEDSSASGHDEPWIQWFCGLKGHEMFCQVERAYIEDGFNLYGLRACVSNYSDCLDLILDRIGPEDSDDSHLTQSACTLYGLIHARYIVTTHGLDSMYNKYAAKEFGTCPLVQCNGQPVLPVGLRDEIGIDTTKIFCPKCKGVYQPTPPMRSYRISGSGGGGSFPPSSNFGTVDGAAFGTTFPHLFLMTFNNLVPDPLLPESAYIPRVFGFRVHQSALVRQGGGAGGGGSGGGPFAALSNNGRRGGGTAVTIYSQRSLGNASSTRATGGSSRSNGGGLGGLPTQDGVNIDEGKEGGSDNEEADDGGYLKKADSGLEEGAPAEEEGEAVVGEMNDNATPNAGNGDVSCNQSKKRELLDEGKRSGSSSGSKRPRRGEAAGT